MFANPKTYLSILTVLGLVLGFVGGAISQLKKTSSDVDGTNSKKLSSFGKLAFAISIIGFAGSFASELLKSAIAADDKRTSAKQLEDDAKWKDRSEKLSSDILNKTESNLSTLLETKLAVSEAKQRLLNESLLRETRLYGRLSAVTAPLSSINITLTIQHVSPVLIASLGDIYEKALYTVQHDWPYVRDWIPLTERQEEEETQALASQRSIQPIIGLLAGYGFKQSHGVLVLTLDNSVSTLFCIGDISTSDVRSRVDALRQLPSGISIDEYPEEKREKQNKPKVDVSVIKDSVVIRFDLTSDAINDALLHYSSVNRINASLPSAPSLFIWTPFNPVDTVHYAEYALDLPFYPGDAETFRDADTIDIRYSGRDRSDTFAGKLPWMDHMRLEITPNGVEEISKVYDLTPFSEGGLKGVHGFARIWHGKER
jgi:hypothetical protein